MRNLLAGLVHARTSELAGGAAARHYMVTVLAEELIAKHGRAIPEELEEAFAYLGEQIILLARKAAGGVMVAFAVETAKPMALPMTEPLLVLPAF
jgi:hypothetical protein